MSQLQKSFITVGFRFIFFAFCLEKMKGAGPFYTKNKSESHRVSVFYSNSSSYITVQQLLVNGFLFCFLKMSLKKIKGDYGLHFCLL